MLLWGWGRRGKSESKVRGERGGEGRGGEGREGEGRGGEEMKNRISKVVEMK